MFYFFYDLQCLAQPMLISESEIKLSYHKDFVIKLNVMSHRRNPKFINTSFVLH